jgi:hypothetical protein
MEALIIHTGTSEWLMSYDSDMTHTKCQHGPIPEDRNKNYLKKGSDALMAIEHPLLP